jgi:alkylhydroperoxidase family enzyme
MSEISYDAAPVPIREDLPAAHRRAWQRLAQPGNWWTGAERVAIAAEVRNARQCRLCAERGEALSPAAGSGEHDTVTALPTAAVEVIHRVTLDHGRLTRSWFEKTLAAGLDDAHYVEIIGVVVTVVSIDSFCRGLGVPLHPLPEPIPGEPSQRRPPGAQAEEAWVPMISFRRAKGEEADLYDGKPTGNVIRAMSLVPDAVRTLKDLSAAHYLSPDRMIDLSAGRSLDRSQMELIAARVSALNECFY